MQPSPPGSTIVSSSQSEACTLVLCSPPPGPEKHHRYFCGFVMFWVSYMSGIILCLPTTFIIMSERSFEVAAYRIQWFSLSFSCTCRCIHLLNYQWNSGNLSYIYLLIIMHNYAVALMHQWLPKLRFPISLCSCSEVVFWLPNHYIFSFLIFFKNCRQCFAQDLHIFYFLQYAQGFWCLHPFTQAWLLFLLTCLLACFLAYFS